MTSGLADRRRLLSAALFREIYPTAEAGVDGELEPEAGSDDQHEGTGAGREGASDLLRGAPFDQATRLDLKMMLTLA